MSEATRCGYVGLVGRPNVGKSTLMNALLGQKLAITAAKPQTTRHHIIGIKTVAAGQLVFVDTPGIHIKQPRAINRYMNRIARAVLADVDVVLWLLEAGKFTDEDERIGEQLNTATGVVMIVVNKIDRVSRKDTLLPFIAELDRRWHPHATLLLSALKRQGLEALESQVMASLPFNAPLFSADEITDRSERFLASEFIREQVTRQTHAELPYATTVEIERFEDRDGLCQISALIWVEREGQKAIIIGKGGSGLKRIGSEARKHLEVLLDRRVFLELWVKTRDGWSNSDRALRSLGYTD